MTFIGFDPERLADLRRLVRLTLDGVEALRCADPAATESMSIITRVASTLRDQCLGTIDRLIDSTVFDSIGGVGIAPMTALDPSAPPMFLTTGWSDDDIIQRANELAATRIRALHDLVVDPADSGAQARVAATERSFAALAALCRRPGPTAHDLAAPALLARMDPAAAAFLIGHLALGADALAAACSTVLRRWHDGPPAGDGRSIWTDHALAGANTADVLFTLLSQRPTAATEFIRRTIDRPELLLDSAQSSQPLEHLLQVALDPARVAPAEAGRLLIPLISWTFGPGMTIVSSVDADIASPRAAIAQAATPWLMQFGPRSDDWGWTVGKGTAMLERMIADPVARQELLGSLDAWRAQLPGIGLITESGRINGPLLDEITAMFAQIDTAIRDVIVDQAVAAKALSDTVLGLGEALVALIPIAAGPLLSVAVGAAVHLGVQQLDERLQRIGFMPPDVGDVAADQTVALDTQIAATLVTVTMTVVDHLIEAGKLPADSWDRIDLHGVTDAPCRTAAARERLERFVEDVGDDIDDDAYYALRGVIDAVANTRTVLDHCPR